MVNTRSSSSNLNSQNPPPNTQPALLSTPPHTSPLTNLPTESLSAPPPDADASAQQFAFIVACLATIDSLVADVAALKEQSSDVPPTESLPGASNKTKAKEISFGPREHRKLVWSKTEDDETDNPWGHRNQTRRPYTKMEFPKFEGGDPHGWILKAEKYFRYYEMPDELKVDVAAMYLEGDALDLFAWINKEWTLVYWEELVKALQENYRPAEFQNPDEHLCGIRQIGYVQEYRQEFAKRSARVSNWLEHCLLGVFLNGLKEKLRADVRIHKPRTVYKAMTLALEFETKLGSGRGTRGFNWSNLNRPPPTASSFPFRPTLVAGVQHVPTTANVNSRNTGTSNLPSNLTTSVRLSNGERQNRIAKGLCFRCNEKFVPGHRCKLSSFSLMEMNDAEDAADEQLVEHGEGEELETDFAEISLHAILGKASGTTMKLKGSLMGSLVLILVDSGSTYNFISLSLVASMNIPIEKIVPFGVQIGKGEVIRCNQVCRKVPVQLLGLQITQDFYPFTIGGADLVLGIKWLVSLNTVQANWNEMFMIFYIDGKRYRLQGVPALSKAEVSFQAISKLNVTKSMVTPDLTKKNAFQWSKRADLAFDQLKTALTTVPVLGLPNFGCPSQRECDASS
ncbi:hypothetical protein NL676_022395 [Syzygium grande]|nr:hypothetical protein NL676_022395 [Syzygium grande]